MFQHPGINDNLKRKENYKKLKKLTEENKGCVHDPFDRDIDENEDEYCTICGEVIKTSDERYSDDDTD